MALAKTGLTGSFISEIRPCTVSPPVAMAAFYLKGVAGDSVLLSEIFSGMLPFMALQLLALFLVYYFPILALWLPNLLIK